MNKQGRAAAAGLLMVSCALATHTGFARAEAPLPNDGPLPPASLDRPATLAEAEAEAPVGSCLHDPAAPGCPRVRQIIYVNPPTATSQLGVVTPMADEAWSNYAPQASASSDGVIPPGYGCAHFEKRPYKVVNPTSNDVGYTYSDHKCRASFSYVETDVCLQRFGSPQEGTWANLDCGFDSRTGGVQFRTSAEYDCAHPKSTWGYRNSSQFYSVHEGNGYFDSGTAVANISNCR